MKHYLYFLTLFLFCSIRSSFGQRVVFSQDFSLASVSESWNLGSDWKITSEGLLFNARYADGADTIISSFINIESLDNQPSVKVKYRNVLNYHWANIVKVLCREFDTDTYEEVFSSAATSDDEITVKFSLPIKYDSYEVKQVQLMVVVSYYGGGLTSLSSISIENADIKSPNNILIRPSYSGVHIDYSNYVRTSGAKSVNLKISSVAIENMNEEADISDISQRKAYTYDISPGNLKFNTKYYLYFQADFGSDGLSEWLDTSFVTENVISKLPYKVDFERSEIDYDIRILRSGTKNNCDTISNAIYHSGDHSFFFNTQKGRRSYMILPAINGNLSDYQVRFFVYRDSVDVDKTSRIRIGVVSDSSAYSFSEVQTLQLVKVNQWEECIIQFKQYEGNNNVGTRIVFRSDNNNSDNSFYIDDILIEPYQPCANPMLINVSEITGNTAKVSWVAGIGQSEWNMHISSVKISDVDAVGSYSPGVVRSNPYNLSSLGPNRTYYLYLQSSSACTNWVETVFKTSVSYDCPYSQNFTDVLNSILDKSLPNDWVGGVRSMENDKEYSEGTYRVVVQSGINHTMGASKLASLSLSGSNTYLSYAILPFISCHEDFASKILMFWAKPTVSAKMLVGFAKMNTGDLPEGGQLFDNITITDSISFVGNEWQEIIIPLTKYRNDYGRYLVLMCYGTTPSLCSVNVDDITIDSKPTCYHVNSLTAYPLTTSSIKVCWQDKINVGQWRLKLSKERDFNPNDPLSAGCILNTTVSNTNEYVFVDETHLHAGDTVYVYIRPEGCSDERLWRSVPVHTAYAVDIPYSNDFEEEQVDVASSTPLYWTMGNNLTQSSSVAPYVYSQSWTNSDKILKPLTSNRLRLVSGTSTGFTPFAIFPAINFPSLKDVHLSFYCYSNDESCANVFKIGVVDNVSSGIDNVKMVSKIQIEDTEIPMLVNVDFDNYIGDGKFIVIYSDTNANNDISIDNLLIADKSFLWKVSDVRTTKIGSKNLDIVWNDVGTANQWEVSVFSQMCASVDAISSTSYRVANIMTNTNSLTISGLSPLNEYFIYVRSKQGDRYSEWSDVFSVFTNCDALDIPLLIRFDDFTTGSSSRSTFPNCYNVDNSSPNNYPYVRLYNVASDCSLPHSSGNLLYMSTLSSKPICQWELPFIHTDINKLQMTVEACSYSADPSQVGIVSLVHFGVVTMDGIFHELTSKQLSNPSEWAYWTIDFSSYAGLEGRLAIRQEYEGVNTCICLDNIAVESIPECPVPDNIRVTQVSSSTISLMWNGSPDLNSYDVAYSRVPMTNPDAASYIQTGSLSCTLSMLLSGTKYYIYVRGSNSTKSCESSWSKEFCVSTLCDVKSVPFTIDFEEYQNGDKIDCATLIGDVTNQAFASVVTQASLPNTSKVLKLSQVRNDFSNYFVFPAVNCRDVRDLQLSMQVYSGNNSAGKTYYYEIGVLVNPYDLSTYSTVCVDSIKNEDTNFNKRDVLYTLDSYSGDVQGQFGSYLVIRLLNSLNSRGEPELGELYIDNVKITNIEKCVAPSNIKLVQRFAQSAVIKWEDDGDGDKYSVAVFSNIEAKPELAEPDKQILVSGKNREATITDLKSNSSYVVFVRSDCGTQGMSYWSYGFTFNTSCSNSESLPYYEGFERVTDGQECPCWTNYSSFPDAISNTKMAKVKINTSTSTFANSGNGCLHLERYITSGQNNYEDVNRNAHIISPKLDIDRLEDMVIYLSVRSDSFQSNVVLEIEAVEELSAESRSLPITKIESISDSYTTYCIRLSDYGPYTAQFKYISFKVYGGDLYLDDLTFMTSAEVKEICPVSNLKLDSVTNNSFSVSFKENTPWITKWEVAYITAGNPFPTPGTITNVDTNACTIKGVLPGEYDIYVRGKDDNGYYAPWSILHKVQIFENYASIPYSTGFETDDNNDYWIIRNLDNKGNEIINTFIFGNTSDCSEVDVTGDKAMFISNNGKNYNYTLSSSYSFALLPIKLNKGYYNVSLRIRNPGNNKNSNDNFSASIVAAGSKFNNNMNLTLPDGGSLPFNITNEGAKIYNIVSKFQNASWKRLTSQVTVSKSGYYYLTLMWTNGSTGEAGYPVIVDSILVEPFEDCRIPQNITVTKISDTSVTLDWDCVSESGFDYVLARSSNLGNPLSDESVEDVVSKNIVPVQPPICITGLEPDNEYWFYLRAKCDESSSSDWVNLNETIHTACARYSLPYVQTFSAPAFASSDTNKYIDCLYLLKNASTTTMSYLSGLDTLRGNVIRLNKDGIVVLPLFDVEDETLYVEISAFAYSSYLGVLEIGLMDNPTDVNSFKLVKSFNLVEKGMNATSPIRIETFAALLNNYKAESNYIAIRNKGYNSNQRVHIQSIKITGGNCVPVTNLIVTETNQMTAEISWISYNNENEWDLKVSDYSGSEKILNIQSSDVTKTGNVVNYIMTGLQPGNKYNLSLRSICSEESVSEWCVPNEISMGCDVFGLPFNEDFSSLVKDNKIPIDCWDVQVSDDRIEKIFEDNSELHKPAGNVTPQFLWYDSTVSLPSLGLTSYQIRSSNYYVLGDENVTRFNKWLISPKIVLDDISDQQQEGIFLSFNALYARPNGEKAVNSGDRFYVAVSTDGRSWKRENAFEIDLNKDLTNQMQQIVMDISPFAGQNIQFAFYHEATTYQINNKAILVIDDVRINNAVIENLTDHACINLDYKNNGFDINSNQLPELYQSKDYLRVRINSDNGLFSEEQDTVFILHLTSYKETTDTLHKMLCSSDTCKIGNLSFMYPVKDESKPYMAFLVNTMGCDSFVYLYLTSHIVADTLEKEVIVRRSDLPFKFDDFLTVPESINKGEVIIIPTGIDECGDSLYTKYNVTLLEVGLVNANNPCVKKFEIFDYLGRLVYKVNNNLNIHSLLVPNGIYIIKSYYENGEIKIDKYLVE